MSVQIELIPATDNFTVYVKGLNQSDEGQSQGFFWGGGGEGFDLKISNLLTKVKMNRGNVNNAFFEDFIIIFFGFYS